MVLCLITALRRLFYRLGLLKTTHLDIPVIIVGNITLGGTGKTPLIIYLAQLLQQHGYQPGIVSRGYGGKSKTYPCIVTPDSDPAIVGDEPVLIATKTTCPVIVDPNRVSAAQYLRKHYPNCNIILSDDGLQHYALGRDIEIVVLDGERRLKGLLREFPSRLKTVDFVVTNGAGQPREYSMKLIPGTLPDFQNKTIHAVAGIGNPSRFFNMLRTELNLDIIEHPFPDHYKFTQQDLDFGKDKDSVILMTEKDFVKCKKFNLPNLFSVPVKANLPEEFSAAFLNRLKKLT